MIENNYQVSPALGENPVEEHFVCAKIAKYVCYALHLEWKSPNLIQHLFWCMLFVTMTYVHVWKTAKYTYVSKLIYYHVYKILIYILMYIYICASTYMLFYVNNIHTCIIRFQDVWIGIYTHVCIYICDLTYPQRITCKFVVLYVWKRNIPKHRQYNVLVYILCHSKIS